MSRQHPLLKDAEQLAVDAQALANRLYAQGSIGKSKGAAAAAQQLCAVAESMNNGIRTHALCLFFGRRRCDPEDQDD